MSDFATNSQSDAAPGSATQPVESLSVAYRAAVKKYEQFENSSEEQGDETSFYDLLQQLEEVQERVDREGMISVNELVDDVSTGALQFLFLPYYYARVCSRCPVLSRRLHYLTVANGYLQRYVERCMKLHVVDEAEVATMVGAAEVSLRVCLILYCAVSCICPVLYCPVFHCVLCMHWLYVQCVCLISSHCVTRRDRRSRPRTPTAGSRRSPSSRRSASASSASR